MDQESQQKQLKIKLIKSTLSEKNEIVYYAKTKLYSANIKTKTWMYSEIQGYLFLCINYETKNAMIYIFNEQDYTLSFSFAFYRKFSEAYTLYNPLFHYFEISNGFFGFRFESLKISDELYKNVKSLTDKNIETIIQKKPIKKEFEIEETYSTLIKLLKKKLEEEYLFKTAVISEKKNELKHNAIVDIVSKIDINNSSIVFNGSRNDLRSLCDSELELEFKETDRLRIGNAYVYALHLYHNIKNTSAVLGKNCADIVDEKENESIYIASALRHQVLNNNKNSNNDSNNVNKNSNVSSVPNVPTVPKVVNNTSSGVPSIPNVPKIISNTSKGVPSIPVITSNTGKGIPSIPMIPKIVPLKDLKDIPVIEDKSQSSAPVNVSNADRLAEIQGRMGNLKKAEAQPNAEVKPKMSLMDELKLKMMGKMIKTEDSTNNNNTTTTNVASNNNISSTNNNNNSGISSNPIFNLKKAEQYNSNSINTNINTKINNTNSNPDTNNNLNTVRQSVMTTNNTTTNSNTINTNSNINTNTTTSSTPSTTSDSMANFKALMMQRMGGNKGSVMNTNINTNSNTNTSINTNSIDNPSALNLPKKDPITGKIIIEVPEGTKPSDRMDINKLINQANELKAKQNGGNTTTTSKSTNVRY